MGIPHEPPDAILRTAAQTIELERLRAGGFGSVKRGWILAQFASRLHRPSHTRPRAGAFWREPTSTRGNHDDKPRDTDFFRV